MTFDELGMVPADEPVASRYSSATRAFPLGLLHKLCDSASLSARDFFGASAIASLLSSVNSPVADNGVLTCDLGAAGTDATESFAVPERKLELTMDYLSTRPENCLWFHSFRGLSSSAGTIKG
jgi:hypothetical protein